MTPRLWALPLSLAPLLAAGTAHAQAPGEVPSGPGPAPAPYYAPPGPAYAPPPPYAVPPPPPSVMAHRWALGLSLGGYGVAPDSVGDGMETQFRVAELAVRYRASRRLEVELALSGGREVIDDSVEGDLAVGTVTVGLRYRFRPEHRWNWFVMAGLGGTVIAPHESTESEREGATRPLGMLGVGIERRFRRFALQAELRTVGIGEREDASGGDVPIVDGPAAPPPPVGLAPPPRLPGSAATVNADQLAGGMFTLGASFYF